MSARPPSDAIVALRSLGRRFREVFASDDDEAVDELAQRNGTDGHSAFDHVVAAGHTIAFLGRALDLVLIEDDPVLHPAVLDARERAWPDATGTVHERLSELSWEAEAVAERAERVPAHDWTRHGRVAGHDRTVSAAEVVWDAVDSAVMHLKAAGSTLRQVR
ncbi:MAG: hypothetical protein WD691_00180 [Acidimicrobiales bacterium]